MHALDAEVPRRDVTPEALGERQHEAAHAGVDVAVGADGCGQRGDRRDGVDDALRVLRRRPDDEHGVRSDGGRHRVDVGRPVVAHGCRDDAHVEQVGRLVERGVGALGEHDLGCGDAPLDPARSRAASTAHWIDSVPPLVRNPAALGPCRRSAVQRTTSDWIAASDGNAAVFSAFSCRYIVAARSATSWTVGPPS